VPNQKGPGGKTAEGKPVKGWDHPFTSRSFFVLHLNLCSAGQVYPNGSLS
jgi:hypothetical protein